jgi:hypothetical protein
MAAALPFAIPCARCGLIHAQEIGYGLPDAALSIPEEDASRLVGDKDHLAIDQRLFFIRAWAPVPLLFAFPPDLLPANEPAAVIRNVGADEERFGIGFWIKVKEAAYRDYLECETALLAGEPQPHASYQGKVANQFDLRGHSLGTVVRASFRAPVHGAISAPAERTDVLWGQRPEIHALDPQSWLGRLQRSGLSAQAHAAWMERCAHPNEPEPPGPPFTADLKMHGWQVLASKQTNLPPHSFAEPPSPGDYVKLAIRFLSVDPDGEVCARNAGWWICLDDAKESGMLTGTLLSVPPPGSPIANGARVWFAPDFVVGHQLPEA